MGLRNLTNWNDPAFRKASRPVEKFDERLRTLLDDMRETLEKVNGYGCAAVHVGILRRVFIVNDESGVIELINPVIVEESIGIWTAEMLMIFCLQRPDVMSYGDLGIHRGLRMLYHHRKIDRKLFDKYARRYSPYGSAASLYLWAIAGGAIPEMRDHAPGKAVK